MGFNRRFDPHFAVLRQRVAGGAIGQSLLRITSRDPEPPSAGYARAIDNCRQSSYGRDQRTEVHSSDGLARTDNVTELTTVLADAADFL